MEHGLRPKIHADEYFSIGGAELASSWELCPQPPGCGVSQEGIDSMARTGVVAVLLPATMFTLMSDAYADAGA